MPGMHHACIVRSPHGAAKIKSINIKPALDFPGVAAVFTGKDTEKVGPVPCGSSLPGLRVPHHHILAMDRVYFVGHPVAVVVATDRYIARDAADAIEVDYEPLPAVSRSRKGPRARRTRRASGMARQHGLHLSPGGGDIDKAFADAEVVVKQRITSQRLIPSAMETRGCVAEWRSGDKSLPVHLHTPPGPAPGCARWWRRCWDCKKITLRVVTPEVGGGFGSKIKVYAEEALMGFIAMKIGKPMKWIESRRENFTGTIHGRGHVDYYEIAAKRDGTILGIKLQPDSGSGRLSSAAHARHPHPVGADDARPLQVPEHSRGYRRRLHQRRPTDAYRGAGRPEATHGIERMVDILAAELKMDPAEIRFKNFIGNDEFPYRHRHRPQLRQRQLRRAAREGAGCRRLQEARAEQEEARAEGRLMGIGMSTYGEICAFGPSPATPAGGWESATVKIEPSGTVTVMTGCSPHGQGEETTFAQIAADELGVGIDDVLVVHGDTAIVQYGIGTFGSRGTAIGGTAMYFAIQELKEKIKKYGALLLDSDDVTFANGACT